MARWFVDRIPQWRIPSVSLRRLLPDGQFVGGVDWEVSGCTDDHRRLEPGQVFVAFPEARTGYDGHSFVREALERGAAGVVVERPCVEAGRLQVVVRDARSSFARICQALAGDPSRRLLTVGVAGSLGKSITALMVRSILEAAGQRCGLVGSMGFCDGVKTRVIGAGFDRIRATMGARPSGSGGLSAGWNHNPSGFAPGPKGLAALLAEMLENGCNGGVIEVSNEGLLHRSFEGICFQAAALTDITAACASNPDIAIQRRRAAAKLIRQVVPGGVVVVSAADPHAEILGAVNLDARRVAYALEPVLGTDVRVDFSGRLERLDGSGTRMVLNGFDREAVVHLPLVGLRAANCALAAAALAWSLEIDRAAIVAGLEAVRDVAGHLETVLAGQDFDVRIDEAQTSFALGEALAAMRAIATGRVHCVLSVEGDTSDHTQRRRLAETAEAGADQVILTMSNPRTSDSNRILEDTLGGFQRPVRVCVEPDRQRAIESALAGAHPGDAVLIAGKGRQTYQILADRVIPFDDRIIARQWLTARRSFPVQRTA
jgi:UDP-N-acetylmuramoyl-L-alanyl-D-glutamate--2,6-diaminopimelate ligase